MGLMTQLRNTVRRAVHSRAAPIWYHTDYRLPVTSLASRTGLEPRRADFIVWTLLELGVIGASELRIPRRVQYADLARVHDEDYLESLTDPVRLARVFGVEAWDVPVEPLLRSIRLACGGTLAAAQHALETRGPTLNLHGGFHHAYPDRGTGLCAVNDIAVAVARLRHDGFDGQVCVLDLDAHPPDGVAACMSGDAKVWIGSLSGSDWGDMPGVDETVLREDASDAEYMRALKPLLERMPTPDLAFVIAGADVLAGDRFGLLGLSLEGTKTRDALVRKALSGVASVWVPGGGYSPEAWRALAQTAQGLVVGAVDKLSKRFDPMTARFSQVYDAILPGALDGDDAWFTEADLAEAMGVASDQPHKLLGYYTTEGVEYAYHRYGLLRHLRRLGYEDFSVKIDKTGGGDRLRAYGEAAGQTHLLSETIMERASMEGRDVLFINWLTLRHPLATFHKDRPRLPGQDMPGLGLAREAGELLWRIAKRLGLHGVAFRPAHFHIAYATRSRFRFVDAERQGRFLALLRDLKPLGLLEATRAVSEGRVTLNGAPYAWEATDMLYAVDKVPYDKKTIHAVRDASHFRVLPRSAEPADTSAA